MLDQLFLPDQNRDKWHRSADHRSGAYSILTGIAANTSFVSGEPTRIADLVKNIAYPDYAKRPPRSGPLPMPKKV